MVEHTGGEWSVFALSLIVTDVYEGQGVIAQLAFGDQEISGEEAAANAERIVACVNALRAFSNEEIENLKFTVT